MAARLLQYFDHLEMQMKEGVDQLWKRVMEKIKRPDTKPGVPPAGPHAKPELTDESKTPGAGTLPPPGKSDDGNPAPTG